jgi:serine-type D-Ala-D-Ala carboxypeptidase/endopeptidase
MQKLFFYLGLFLISLAIVLLSFMLYQTYQTRIVMDTHDLPIRIEQQVKDYVQQRPNVSLMLGIYQKGDWYSQGFSNDVAMKPTVDNLYQIGSITKLFTSLALAQLSLAGTVNLDDRVGGYLAKAIDLPPEISAITLRQLATHTSGLPRLPANLLDHANPENPYQHYNVVNLYTALKTTHLEYPADEKIQYSNLGMGLLGHLLMLKTGQSYGKLIEKTIVQPMSLGNTLTMLESEPRNRLVLGYTANDQIATEWEFNVLIGAGGLYSTMRDLLRFVAVSLHPPDSPLGQAIVLTQKPQFQHQVLGIQHAVGLGWQIMTPWFSKTPILWHNGGTGGFISFLAIDPAQDCGVVLLSNYGDAIVSDASLDKIGMNLLQDAAKISLK